MKTLLRFLLVMLPFGLFGLTYSLMNLLPNYEVNPIHVESTYRLEQALFGVTDADGQILIPSEYCQRYHVAALDILSGVFYLLWVPLPIAFAVYLFLKGHTRKALRFSCCFLFVNLVGFVGYYVYPAVPPWYVMQYGFEPDIDTPGNVAGFVHFDRMLHVNIFHFLYARNANVFAAIPSLHVAYNVVALFYAIKRPRVSYGWIILLSVVSAGICFSAVYSSHHYIIDVILGLLTATVGISIFETLLRLIARRIIAAKKNCS